MSSSVVFTREAEAAEIKDAISELSYIAARKSRVSAELRKLGHQRCAYENEMARLLRRESACAALIEGTWEYEKKKKKLEAELANALAQEAMVGAPFEGEEEEEYEEGEAEEDKGEEAMEAGWKEEEEEEAKEEDEALAAGVQDAEPSDPEEKPKKLAKLASVNPYLGPATRSSHPVHLRNRPTQKP